MDFDRAVVGCEVDRTFENLKHNQTGLVGKEIQDD